MNIKSIYYLLFFLQSWVGYGQSDLSEDGAYQLEFKGRVTFSDSIQKPGTVLLKQSGAVYSEVSLDGDWQDQDDN